MVVINMKFNKGKMKELITYIIHRCGHKTNVGKTVLFKLLYFSDFNHYELYEEQITNETYIKKEFGPAPKHFDEIITELTTENKINIIKKKVHNYHQHNYSTKQDPEISLLTLTELEVVDAVIDKLSDMNATKISEYSHEDKPWRVAKFLDPLDPEFVFYRDEEYSVREYK